MAGDLPNGGNNCVVDDGSGVTGVDVAFKDGEKLSTEAINELRKAAVKIEGLMTGKPLEVDEKYGMQLPKCSTVADVAEARGHTATYHGRK